MNMCTGSYFLICEQEVYKIIIFSLYIKKYNVLSLYITAALLHEIVYSIMFLIYRFIVL